MHHICIYYYICFKYILFVVYVILFIVYLVYCILYMPVYCKITSKTKQAKIKRYFCGRLVVAGVPLQKYLCIWFCVMFVILSQTGENQLILSS